MEKNINNLENKEKRNNYRVIDGLRTFFYVLAINILASIFYSIIVFVINIFYKGTYNDLVNSPFIYYIGLLIIPVSFLVSFYVFNKTNKINVKNAIAPTKKFNIWSLFIVIALVGLMIVGFMPIINMLLSVLENAGMNMGSDAMYPMDSWIRIILGFFAYAVLPAVAEELLFRGIIFRGLSRRATSFCAVLVSALMFCLMHGGIQQTIYQFILGLLLGFVALYTGNIVFPMIMHFLNNFMVVLLQLVNGYNSFLGGFKHSFVGYLCAIGIALGASALIVLFVWLLKKINCKDEKDEQYLVEGENIIIEEKTKKLGFKDFILSFDFNEKFYFYASVLVGLIIWIFNSF